MISVAYVAPYFLPATVRFLAEVAMQPGVQIATRWSVSRAARSSSRWA